MMSFIKKFNRKHIILEHVDKNGFGLEIGPSHSPVAAKRDGFKVDILDHLNKAELKAKYLKHPVNTDNIEDVDFIWSGESYAELIGKKNHYDWIIASHVIEHTPDLIGFLSDCDEVLKSDGVISLAIPDMRYCFDHYRSISSLAEVIDSYDAKRTKPSKGKVIEFNLNVVRDERAFLYGQGGKGDFSSLHNYNYKDAREDLNLSRDSEDYIDLHNWCFVPSSFRLMIKDLYKLGLIPFKEVSFTQSIGSEFYITLGRTSRKEVKDISRQELLQNIHDEVTYKNESLFHKYAYKTLKKIYHRFLKN